MNWLFGSAKPRDEIRPVGKDLLHYLDITYITPKILIVGNLWDAQTMKEEKKNNRKEMASFLNDKHGGKYLIFNFDGNYNDSMAPQWELFGFQLIAINVDSPVDNIFSLDQLFRLSYSLYFWLSNDPSNVAVFIHGRSGLKTPAAVISALFTMTKYMHHPHDALRFVLQKREPDKDADDALEHYPRGYMDVLNYFNISVQSPSTMNRKKMMLDMMVINGLHLPPEMGIPHIDIYKGRKPVFRSSTFSYEEWINKGFLAIPDDGCYIYPIKIMLAGDFTIECYVYDSDTTKKVLFRHSSTTCFEREGSKTLSSKSIDINSDILRDVQFDAFYMDINFFYDEKEEVITENDQIDVKMSPVKAAATGLSELSTNHILQPDNIHFESLYYLGLDSNDVVFALKRTQNNFEKAQTMCYSGFKNRISLDIGEDPTHALIEGPKTPETSFDDSIIEHMNLPSHLRLKFTKSFRNFSTSGDEEDISRFDGLDFGSGTTDYKIGIPYDAKGGMRGGYGGGGGGFGGVGSGGGGSGGFGGGGSGGGGGGGSGSGAFGNNGGSGIGGGNSDNLLAIEQSKKKTRQLQLMRQVQQGTLSPEDFDKEMATSFGDDHERIEKRIYEEERKSGLFVEEAELIPIIEFLKTITQKNNDSTVGKDKVDMSASEMIAMLKVIDIKSIKEGTVGGVNVKEGTDMEKILQIIRAALPSLLNKTNNTSSDSSTSVSDKDVEAILKTLIDGAKVIDKDKERVRSNSNLLEDHPVYSKYFQMLKKGVPRPAVEQLMRREGVDPSILDQDPKKEMPPSPPKSPEKGSNAIKNDPVYGKYFKMIANGVPRLAVELKMKSEGLNPSLLDLDPNAPLPTEFLTPSRIEQVPLNKDPKFANFFNMISKGVPKDVVKQRMEQMGYDPKILDCDPNKPLPTDLGAVDWTKIAGEKAPLISHPVYSKYVLMLHNGGVPKEQIIHKMKSDGQGPFDILDMDPNTLFPLNVESLRLTEVKAKKKKNQAKKVRMTRAEAGEGTIWSTLDDVDDIELEGFKASFVDAPQVTVSLLSPKERESSIKFTKVSILPPGDRQKQIEIGYRRIFNVKNADVDANDQEIEEIALAIAKLDYNFFVKDIRKFEMLAPLMPTIEEATDVCKEVVDNSRLELYDQFFLRMAKVPRCLKSKIKIVSRACEEIMKSTHFKTLLKVVLKVLRELDSVGIDGFSLSSLANLHITKAFDKKTSILQYIENYLHENKPEVLTFINDMPSVSEAMRVEFSDLYNLRKDVNAVLNKAELEMSAQLDDPISKEMYKSAAERAIAASETRAALSPFVNSSKVFLAEIDNELALMAKAYVEMLRFYGELSDIKSHEYFSQINEFFTVFTEIRNKSNRSRESERRKSLRRGSIKIAGSTVSSAPSSTSVSTEASPTFREENVSFLTEERQVLNSAHDMIISGVSLKHVITKDEEKVE